MKKRLLSLFGKTTGSKKRFDCLPHLKEYTVANEYCIDCQLQFCYICGNEHIDSRCNVEWGRELSTKIKLPVSEKNIRFNRGYPFILNLNSLKCPCGTDLLESKNSSICSACGTATCSTECHEKYAEQDGLCHFKDNFFDNLETKNIHGLRNIGISSLLYAIEKEFPPFSKNSISNMKYIYSMTGPVPFTIILQRGFRQYGQPHEFTLNNMKELTGEKATELYNEFETKLCLCNCPSCSQKSPHPIYNCFRDCEKKSILGENEKLALKLYQLCSCTCNFCRSNKMHTKELCLYNCDNYTFKRH